MYETSCQTWSEVNWEKAGMAVPSMPLRMFRKIWPSALPWRKTPVARAGARSPRAPAPWHDWQALS